MVNKGLWSRLTFLLYLAKEYNEEHEETKAVFRLDGDKVDFYILYPNNKDLMFKTARLDDLTEEHVYKIYKAIKDASTTAEE